MAKLTYLGHDAFVIEQRGINIIIDPFLSGNPNAPKKPKEIKVDYVLLTHGHGDHFGDGIEIAKANKATIIAPYELAMYCQSEGCQIHAMYIGGSHIFPFGKVKMTIAHHGSGRMINGKMLYLGNPCGFLITVEGKTVYHAGDTGLFLDMKLIGEMNNIDIALLPIGDNFTMGIDDAIKAVEFLHPHLAIPMHYRTFEGIDVDPNEFVQKTESNGYHAMVIKLGEGIDF